MFRLAERGHSVHVLDSAYKTPKYHHPNLTTISVFVETEAGGFDPWSVVSNDPRRFGNTEMKKSLDFKNMLKFYQEKVRLK